MYYGNTEEQKYIDLRYAFVELRGTVLTSGALKKQIDGDGFFDGKDYTLDDFPLEKAEYMEAMHDLLDQRNIDTYDKMLEEFNKVCLHIEKNAVIYTGRINGEVTSIKGDINKVFDLLGDKSKEVAKNTYIPLKDRMKANVNDEELTLVAISDFINKDRLGINFPNSKDVNTIDEIKDFYLNGGTSCILDSYEEWVPVGYNWDGPVDGKVKFSQEMTVCINNDYKFEETLIESDDLENLKEEIVIYDEKTFDEIKKSIQTLLDYMADIPTDIDKIYKNRIDKNIDAYKEITNIVNDYIREHNISLEVNEDKERE